MAARRSMAMWAAIVAVVTISSAEDVANCPQTRFILRNEKQPVCDTKPGAATGSSIPAEPACGDVGAQLSTSITAATPTPFFQRHRVAICFYSPTRSLQYTLHAIEHNVIAPLLRGQTALEVFVHTYNMSACSGCDANDADVAALAARLPKGVPLFVKVDNQASFIRRLGNELPNTLDTAWRSDGVASGTAQSSLAVLLSLKRVTAMWHARGAFHLVCVLRPDVIYLDALPRAAQLLELGVKAASEGGVTGGVTGGETGAWLLTPPRHFEPGQRVDDTYAIGSPRAALLYGNRADQLLEFMRQNPAKLPDAYLGWYMNELRACVAMLALPALARYLRLHSSGAVNCEDLHIEYNLQLPCSNCESGQPADNSSRERVATDLWTSARLGSAAYQSCFDGTAAQAPSIAEERVRRAERRRGSATQVNAERVRKAGQQEEKRRGTGGFWD